MKKVLVVVIAIFSSCTSPKIDDASVEEAPVMEEPPVFLYPYNVGTSANDEEIAIIDNMNCWKIIYGDVSEYFIDHSKSLSEQDGNCWKHREPTLKEREEGMYSARTFGREYLCNDTMFINIIRNDSLYNALLNERKEIAKNLSIYKNKVPFFIAFIDKISKNIIEYNNYYCFWTKRIGRAVAEKNISNFVICKNDYCYENYSDWLKEEYKKRYENSNIKDEDVKNLNDILKSLEKLDRALWAVKYYKTSKNELEKKNKTKQREEQIDKLFE